MSDPRAETVRRPTSGSAISRNVLLTGLTSFFTDVSSEMVYPLLQAFVSLILAAHRALLGPFLGLIEGLAESTASLLKVFSGYYSDRLARRKPLAVGGYVASALAKLLLLLASRGWVFVLLSRFADRVGKGVRTAPRDALIAESVPARIQGRAFGLQRGMDFAGATIGALLAFFLARRFLDPVTGNLAGVDSFLRIFLISLIPAFLGVVFVLFLRETGGSRKGGKDGAGPRVVPDLDLRRYPRSLQIFFLAELLFSLGNSSNQFLLLRSMGLGVTLPTVILMYLVFNLSSSLLSTPFGALSDRLGRKRVLVLGYGLYAVVYAAFAFIGPGSRWLLWAFWPLYGVYYAMTEGVEKAFVAGLAPEGSRGTALGMSHTIVGVALFPASVLAGLLFSLNPAAPFLFGGGLAAAAVVVLAAGLPPAKDAAAASTGSIEGRE
jgi:MFS family permease